jgi:hypothetical protein
MKTAAKPLKPHREALANTTNDPAVVFRGLVPPKVASKLQVLKTAPSLNESQRMHGGIRVGATDRGDENDPVMVWHGLVLPKVAATERQVPASTSCTRSASSKSQGKSSDVGTLAENDPAIIYRDLVPMSVKRRSAARREAEMQKRIRELVQRLKMLNVKLFSALSDQARQGGASHAQAPAAAGFFSRADGVAKNVADKFPIVEADDSDDKGYWEKEEEYWEEEENWLD